VVADAEAPAVAVQKTIPEPEEEPELYKTEIKNCRDDCGCRIELPVEEKKKPVSYQHVNIEGDDFGERRKEKGSQRKKNRYLSSNLYCLIKRKSPERKQH
jgi:hypothetical protein